MSRDDWIAAVVAAFGFVLISGDLAYTAVIGSHRIAIVGPVLPDSPLGQTMHEARAAERAKNYRHAVALYSQALALEPGPNIISADLRASRGSAYNYLDMPKQAYADYDQAFRDKAPIPDTRTTGRWYLGRGYAALGLEQYQRAKDDLDRVLTMVPNAPNALEWRGLAFEHLGDSERALADYRAALAAEPDNDRVRERVRVLEGR